MNLHGDAAQRLAIYRSLQARNRIVAILRIGVPALGVIALSVLLVQIYISSLSSRFGVGKITVTSERVTVETPQYSGLLDDGTSYRVSATAATAAVDATNRIALEDGVLTMVKPDGVTTNVRAAASVLDTNTQVVEIEGDALVSNSAGTSGIIRQSVFDYEAQTLVGNGPVDLDYRDGTKILAEGLTFDSATSIWTFTRATVTLPDTPGANPIETP